MLHLNVNDNRTNVTEITEKQATPNGTEAIERTYFSSKRFLEGR